MLFRSLLAEFVARLVAVTFAPATTAPVESVTIPEIDPDTCANASLESIRAHSIILTFNNFITHSPHAVSRVGCSVISYAKKAPDCAQSGQWDTQHPCRMINYLSSGALLSAGVKNPNNPCASSPIPAVKNNQLLGPAA